MPCTHYIFWFICHCFCHPKIVFYYRHFRYNATFIDLPVARFSPGKMIHETQVVDAMRGLLENLKQQARTNMSMEDLKDSEPDLK